MHKINGLVAGVCTVTLFQQSIFTPASFEVIQPGYITERSVPEFHRCKRTIVGVLTTIATVLTIGALSTSSFSSRQIAWIYFSVRYASASFRLAFGNSYTSSSNLRIACTLFQFQNKSHRRCFIESIPPDTKGKEMAGSKGA